MNENSVVNNPMIDIPLYSESKLTRKQAISEIAEVILRSNMKPQMVEYALQLLRKLLPVDHTLPATIDELFGSMMSSENDWRLAQYLVKHKQSPSFLSSSMNTRDENSPMTVVGSALFSIQEEELDSTTSPRLLPLNSNESSSSSDDENELSPYDRLQQSLQSITGISTNMNLNYATSLQTQNSNYFHPYNQRSEWASNAVNPLIIHQSLKRLLSETSSTASTRQENLSLERRMFAAFEDDSEDEVSSHSTSDDNDKLCCFEINGRDLLNGRKRRRYY